MKRVRRMAWLTLISLLVLLAVLSGGLRLALPHLNQWRTTLLAHIASASGIPVQASHVQATWHGSALALQVHDLHLSLPDGGSLAAKNISMELDLWRSLLHWRWQFHGLTFSQLTYRSNTPLTFSQPQQQLPDAAGNQQLRDLLLQQFGYFKLYDSQLSLLSASRQRVEIHIVDLNWLNAGQHHRAQGQLRLSGMNGVQGTLQLRADLSQAAAQPDSGTLWLQADKLDITPWLGRWLMRQTNNLTANVSLQAWINLKQGKIDHSQILLKQSQISWRASAPVQYPQMQYPQVQYPQYLAHRQHLQQAKPLPQGQSAQQRQPLQPIPFPAQIPSPQMPGLITAAAMEQACQPVQPASQHRFWWQLSPFAPEIAGINPAFFYPATDLLYPETNHLYPETNHFSRQRYCHLSLITASQRHQLSLNDTRISIQPLADGWQLNIAQPHIWLDRHRWQTGAIAAAWLPASHQQDQQWRIRLNQLDIANISPLFSVLEKPLPQLSQLWQGLQPRGYLQLLALDLLADQPQQSRLQARWQDLSWQAWGNLPAGEHLRGEISGSLAQGRLHLRMDNASVAHWQYLPQPLLIQHASGNLHWQHNARGLLISGDKLDLAAKSLRLNGEFRYQQPANGTPWLAALAGIELTDAADAWRYIPRLHSTTHLADYLHQSLQAGIVHNGTLLFNGDPRQFPWRKNNGVFAAWLPLRQGRFLFQPHWPALDKLDMDLHFVNDGLLMKVPVLQLSQSAGNLSGKPAKNFSGKPAKNLSASQLQARIAHYHQHELIIEADLQGSGEAVTDYFQHTPLQASLGQTLLELPVSGELNAHLRLDIPLHEHLPVIASGEVWLHNNELEIKAINQHLRQLTGSFTFHDGELHGKNLRANWWNQPLTFDFSRQQTAANPWRVTVNMAANWQANRISELPVSLRQSLNGSLRWQSKLTLTLGQAGKANYQLQLHGDLKNLTSRLPAPLDKSAGTALPFAIQVAGNLQQFTLAGKLGTQSRFNSRWLLKPVPMLERALLLQTPADKVTNNSSNPHNNNPTTHSSNNISNNNIIENNIRNNNTPPPLPASASIELHLPATDGRLLFALLQPNISQQLPAIRLTEVPLSLHTPLLRFAGQDWQQFSLSMQPIADGKILTLHAAQLDARLTQYHRARWLADIRYLNYSPSSSSLFGADWQSDENETANGDPPFRHWVDFHLRCESCWLWGKDYGQIRANITRQHNALLLTDGRLDNGIVRLSLTGSWHQQAGQWQTDIKGQLQGDRLDSLTHFLALGKPVQQAPYRLDYQLSWLGAPWQPNIASLNGSLHASLQKGKITDIDTGHASQLLSFFSIDALLRRLRFDFRDKFSDGFYFDSINSRASISNGVLTTDDTLINGLSADIAIEGKVDFPRNQLDLQAVVAPEISTPVSVAAAFAVNPLAGAAVYAASKVLSPLWSKISLLRYHISGEIEKPLVNEVLRQPRHGQNKPSAIDENKRMPKTDKNTDKQR